ncbi:hypothetical protein, partial [Ruminococcus sp.]|uniref:hypothetical protein n=1 Tax=Ruminococcus sp. TaxID=41978 RepID=UPI003F814D34
MRLIHNQKIINALAKNSPQDCFLNARLQVPSSLAGKIKEQINKIDSCMVRVTEFRYEQNTYLAYCGLFIIKKSSTLSL